MIQPVHFQRPLALRLSALLFSVPLSAFALVDSSNRDVLTPNTGLWPTTGVTLGGTTFVNKGLQGIGRFAASSIDLATGESLGSISDMQITNFRHNGNGTWAGTFNFLPDRGFNSGAIFSNYAARINHFDFTFNPSLPALGQNQIAMTFTGSTRFTYDHDNNSATAPIFSTGVLPTGAATPFGIAAPIVTNATTQSDGSFANRLTIDAEGLALDTRASKAGSGWISDEYGASIFHFNSAKQIDGQLKLPDALVPRNGANIDFAVGQVSGNPTSGRRPNQGMEGLALSPDGAKLFGLMQSATIQDSGSGNQGRSNTRLVVYDVTQTDTPNDPSAQYVIQLPRIDDNGPPAAVNRAGAQSSIVALNDHQLLILSRDGNGRGANNGSAVFKSILLADLRTGTNIDGLFDAAGNAVAPGGNLDGSITPIQWTEALNLLGGLGSVPSEIGQFGLNLNANNGNSNTLSEKWEALSLVPTDDGTGDMFLFVGNDNDFITATTRFLDNNGVLQTAPNGLENDTMVLVYRVSAVPVPAAAWLLLSGVAGLGCVRRRR